MTWWPLLTGGWHAGGELSRCPLVLQTLSLPWCVEQSDGLGRGRRAAGGRSELFASLDGGYLPVCLEKSGHTIPMNLVLLGGGWLFRITEHEFFLNVASGQ